MPAFPLIVAFSLQTDGSGRVVPTKGNITRNRRHFAPAKYLARGFKLSRWRHKESIKKAVDRKNKD